MLFIPLLSFFLLVQGVLEGNGFGKKIVNEKAFGFSQNFVVVSLLNMCKSLYGGRVNLVDNLNPFFAIEISRGN